MAQGNGNAASEAAQAAQAAAAAAAAAASNPTLIQHMTNFGGRAHHEAELNLSQNSNPGNGENPDHMNPGKKLYLGEKYRMSRQVLYYFVWTLCSL